MSNTATRLITLIMLLQRRPNQKAADLAGELGVSVRTLHRYFTMLDEMGIPVYSERGPYGGFSLVRGYKIPPLVFTPEEAVAVFLGTGLVGEVWGSLYRAAARGALAKIENVLPDEQRSELAWAQRSLFSTGLHRGDFTTLAPLLEKLRSAVRWRRSVSMSYQSSGRPELSERRFDPYALVHRYGWWYAIGFCHLRQGLRTFRVDRIQSLEPTREAFSLPDDFDLQAYLANEFRSTPEMISRLRFQPEYAHVVQANRLFWKTIEEQPDGALIVTFSTPDLLWAAITVMSYGPIVEVLEPEELRQEVCAWAQAVVDLYRKQL